MNVGLTILTISRNRPDKLKLLIESINRTLARNDLVTHLIYIDDDDVQTLDLINSRCLDKIAGYSLKWHIGPRPKLLSDAWNAVWEVRRFSGDVFIGLTDDYEIMTKGWDEILIQSLSRYEDRVAVGYLPDPIAPNMLTMLCGTSMVFNEMGYFCAPYFPFWFGDWWLDEIAQMIDRKITVPIKMQPQNMEKGKTHGMRNLPFWWEYFHRTRIERRELADQLRRKICDPGTPSYQESHKKELQVVAEAETNFYNTDIGWLKQMEAVLSNESGCPTEIYQDSEERARRHVEQLEVKRLLKEKMESLKCAVESGTSSQGQPITYPW